MRKIWMILCLAIMAMFLVSCQPGKATAPTTYRESAAMYTQQITTLKTQLTACQEENFLLVSQSNKLKSAIAAANPDSDYIMLAINPLSENEVESGEIVTKNAGIWKIIRDANGNIIGAVDVTPH